MVTPLGKTKCKITETDRKNYPGNACYKRGFSLSVELYQQPHESSTRRHLCYYRAG